MSGVKMRSSFAITVLLVGGRDHLSIKLTLRDTFVDPPDILVIPIVSGNLTGRWFRMRLQLQKKSTHRGHLVNGHSSLLDANSGIKKAIPGALKSTFQYTEISTI